MSEKILIIDDDLDTLRLVGLMLQKKGYAIVAANNGKQGLRKAETELPDLILLDVMMPEMDGYEVARRLRDNPDTKNIPILMFTAKSQLDDKVSGFEAGADDYLTKPTHPAELHAHVKALLARFVGTTRKAPSSNQKSYTVGILSARGGLGVSSIALNLASTLTSQNEKNITVFELIPGTGSFGRDFVIPEFAQTIQLLEQNPQEINLDAVTNSLFEHKAGFKVFPTSEAPIDMALSTQIAQLEKIFVLLQKLSDTLIVDFGSGLLRVNQTLLPLCDLVIVVIEAFESSLIHAKKLLSNLDELGIAKEQVLIVLNNRIRSEMLLSYKQAVKEIDVPIAVTITPAPELFFQSKRLHTTSTLHQPNSMTAQQFQQLAKKVLEVKAEQA